MYKLNLYKLVLQNFTAGSLLGRVVLLGVIIIREESTGNDKLLAVGLVIKFQERIVVTMMQSHFLDIILFSARADL